MLLMIALCASGTAIAQSAERQVIGASGGSYSGASMQADYTVGETVTASGSSGSFSVNQGFQQNKITPAGIAERNLLVNYSLYPNPANDLINLTLTTKESFSLRISVSNISGQTLLADAEYEKVSAAYKREISISAFSSGTYFVNLYDDKSALLKSILFIKQ